MPKTGNEWQTLADLLFDENLIKSNKIDLNSGF